MEKVLEVKNLVVHFHTDYGTVQALDRCNIGVNEGEILGLIGESGCGKSTIAKSILGVVPSPPGKIVDGQILFKGQDILKMNNKMLNANIRGRAISLVPQDPYASFNPVFTIGTQIKDILKYKSPRTNSDNWYNRTLSGGKTQKTNNHKVISMLQELQIPSPESQLSKYPYQLSGGQRQRIMIAMALLTNSSLIIADEITTALDVTIEAQILRLLRQLVKDHRVSVLFITHDLGVASQVCDRVVTMYAGQEVEIAPIASFFARPSHPYTKKLLESLPNPQGEIMDIPGEVPNLIDYLPGCRFELRCEFAKSDCRLKRPAAREIYPDHWIRCFNPN
jgi:peptide/nickel transport system ATP-binding protein